MPRNWQAQAIELAAEGLSDPEIRAVLRREGASYGSATAAVSRSKNHQTKANHYPLISQSLPPVRGQSEALKRYELAKASQWHLIDLKRANHSPRFTELAIAPDSDVITARRRATSVQSSYMGSAAALCAEGAASCGGLRNRHGGA